MVIAQLVLTGYPRGCYARPMKQTKVSLPDDLRDKLRARAEKEDSSESRIIRAALRAYLNQEAKPA